MREFEAGYEGGILTLVSALDGQERIFAYRKLPRIGIFATTGVDTADIRLAWLDTMSRHLIFGLPATVAMVGLCLMALRRTRREAAANAMLRQEIARREATEDALRQSQKMEAVGRLTGGIAHDFNNLLTAIIGNLDLALRGQGEDRIRTMARQSARPPTARPRCTAARLLAPASARVKSVDINRLVQGMSELFAARSRASPSDRADRRPATAIDPNQLENAILNLAVNARGAMAQGRRLTIETANCHLDEPRRRPEPRSPGTIRHGGDERFRQTCRGVMPARSSRSLPPNRPASAGQVDQGYGFAKQSGGHIRIYSEIGEGPQKLISAALAGSPAFRLGTTRPACRRSRSAGRGPCWWWRTTAGQQACGRGAGGRAIAYFRADAPPAARAAPHRFPAADVVLPASTGVSSPRKVLRLRPAIKVLFVTGCTRTPSSITASSIPTSLLTKPFTAEALTRRSPVLDGKGAAKQAQENTPFAHHHRWLDRTPSRLHAGDGWVTPSPGR
jgi:two-component system NtrC family sensor kinase